MRDFRHGMLPSVESVRQNIAAALTLAAIAIPEQVATARLAGTPPSVGLLVFVVAGLGFFLAGSSRYLSVGADSTIAPIFASALGAFAAIGSADYLLLSAGLAISVGVLLMVSGILRLGWIARLLSIPVATGFLAGIAFHIAASQLPALLGLQNQGSTFGNIVYVYRHWNFLNPIALAMGMFVFAATFLSERIDIRLPGALIASLLVTLLAWKFQLAHNGLPVLGELRKSSSLWQMPDFARLHVLPLIALAPLVSLIVIIQTVATESAFPDDEARDVNRDLIGVGVANILVGSVGGFPANSSPPRTAIVHETRATSRLACLIAALIVGGFLLFGIGLLAYVPNAALAGLIFYVAQRLVRVGTISKVAAQSYAEFCLMLATATAIIFVPIQAAIAIGVFLSLLHGVWTISQTRAIEFAKVPGSTVWWPATASFHGEQIPGIAVVGFQAPLFFVNSEAFRKSLEEILDRAERPVKAIIVEASGMVEVDFSGAQALIGIIQYWKARGVDFYLVRLESVRAQQALDKFGILAMLGDRHRAHSVQEIVVELSKGALEG